METIEKQATSSECAECGNASKRFGKHRNGLQRYRCLSCGKTFTEEHARGFRVEDYLKDPRGLRAVRMLVEGCSIRSVERLTGIRKGSLIELLLIAGQRCEAVLERVIRKVKLTDIQMDECWNFIYCKEKNKGPESTDNDETGDNYNWVAIDRPTKLVCAFVCGKRTGENAMELCRQIRRATNPAVRFQLTSDGLQAYIAAVDEFLLDRCDYAQLVKNYTQPQDDDHRYSPPVCTGAVKVVISGNPDEAKICTSHVERLNLSLRTQVRRMTRLTNAFSRKLENHRAAIALYLGWYNFCQIHGSLRVTPAMEAAITDHVWNVAELLA